MSRINLINLLQMTTETDNNFKNAIHLNKTMYDFIDRDQQVEGIII